MNIPPVIGTILYVALFLIILCKIRNKNTKVIWVLLNCVIISLLFFQIFYNDDVIDVETFIESMDTGSMVEPSTKIMKDLKNKILDTMKSNDTMENKYSEVLTQVKKTKDNLTTNEEKEEFNKYVEYVKNEHQPAINKIESGMNNAPPENIKTLDNLSKENFATLQKVYSTMSTNEVVSMFELDNDKFTKMLNEITNSNK